MKKLSTRTINLMSYGFGPTLDIKLYGFECVRFREIVDHIRGKYVDVTQWPLQTKTLEIIAEKEGFDSIDGNCPGELRLLETGGFNPEIQRFIIDEVYYKAKVVGDMYVYRETLFILFGIAIYLRDYLRLSPRDAREYLKQMGAFDEARLVTAGEIFAGMLALNAYQINSTFEETLVDLKKGYLLAEHQRSPGSLELSPSNAMQITKEVARRAVIPAIWVWRRFSCSNLFSIAEHATA